MTSSPARAVIAITLLALTRVAVGDTINLTNFKNITPNISSIPAASPTTAAAAAADPASTIPVTLVATPRERVVVRTVGGQATFVLDQSGTPFVPRGANYNRFADRARSDGEHEWWFNTFDVGKYDSSQAESALAQMELSKYNYVRVMIAGPDVDKGFGLSAPGIGPAYLLNVADFLNRAKAHGIFVTLEGFFDTIVNLPPNYLSVARANGLTANTSGSNSLIFDPGYARALGQFYRDFLRDLKALPGDPSQQLLSIGLYNELSVNSHDKPLSATSGSYVLAGKTYDLSSGNSRQSLIDDATKVWLNTIITAIRTVDGRVMIGASVFTIGATGRSSFNGARVGEGDSSGRAALRPSVMAATNVDYLDIHVYPTNATTYSAGNPSTNYSFAEDMRKEEVTTSGLGKPIMMGEISTFKAYAPTRDIATTVLKSTIAQSCRYGFRGWGFWTWDNYGDKPNDAWALVEKSGAMNAFFAPSVNADLCSTSTVTPTVASPQPEGYFKIELTIYYSNGASAFCKIANWDDYLNMGGKADQTGVTVIGALPSGMRNDGVCASPNIRKGYFKPSGGANGIMYSNGAAHYCVYRSWQSYLDSGGRADQNGVLATTEAVPASMTSDGFCP